jgi:hypothetical protein
MPKMGSMVAETDFFVSPLLDELEQAFETSFNQAWFRILAEDSPIDSPRFREVEAFFISKSSYESDPRKIMEIVIAIEEIVSLVRQFLLPHLRDRLRVSGFYARDNTLSKEHKIKYGFIAYAFPHNINRIESLTGKIRAAL